MACRSIDTEQTPNPVQSSLSWRKKQMLPAFDDHSREVEDTSQNRQEKVFQAPKNYLNSSKVIVYVISKW